MQVLISPPVPGEVDTPVWLAGSLTDARRDQSWQGKSIGRSLELSPQPESRWATTAGVLLVPESELTEQGHRVKERWRNLIVEARKMADACPEKTR